MPSPDRLHFTGDDAADALIAREPLALLIGFALDQQITVQTAFAGPLKLQLRLGSLDAGTIAATDPAELEAMFRQPPAIHRFPGSMAKRVHDLCAYIEAEYDGRAERVWTEATDAMELERRIRALPGFGDMKVKALGAVLASDSASRRRSRSHRATRRSVTSTRSRRSRRIRPRSALTRRPVEQKLRRPDYRRRAAADDVESSPAS